MGFILDLLEVLKEDTNEKAWWKKIVI
jgi:hypothetical protein